MVTGQLKKVLSSGSDANVTSLYRCIRQVYYSSFRVFKYGHVCNVGYFFRVVYRGGVSMVIRKLLSSLFSKGFYSGLVGLYECFFYGFLTYNSRGYEYRLVVFYLKWRVHYGVT